MGNFIQLTLFLSVHGLTEKSPSSLAQAVEYFLGFEGFVKMEPLYLLELLQMFILLLLVLNCMPKVLAIRPYFLELVGVEYTSLESFFLCCIVLVLKLMESVFCAAALLCEVVEDIPCLLGLLCPQAEKSF